MRLKILALSKSELVGLNFALPALAFAIPFLIAQPQWLIGTLVNAFLFLFADRLKNKSSLFIVALPSLGAVTNGLVFGPATPFLIYFLPFIWLGNYLLIWIYKRLGTNYWLKIVSASVIKSSFLFLFANIYFSLHFVPKLFLTAMGLTQLATAISGGLLAFIIINLINKKNG